MATDTERRTALDARVARELSDGGTLESQSGFTAVVVKGRRVNHVLHAILSLLTAGIWLIVWLLLVLTNKRQRVVLLVNEDGGIETTVTQVGISS